VGENPEGSEGMGYMSDDANDAPREDTPQTKLEDSPLSDIREGETIPDAMERIAQATLPDIVAQEKNLIVLEDANDYIGLNVGLGLSYITDLLPVSSDIFYVGFSGPKGSGKSKATRFCALVANKGMKVEAITFPALAHACMEKLTLCLDEIDSQGERCPELVALLREGISLDGKYIKMTPAEGKDWTFRPIPCGGIKFINWNSANKLDSAFLQRILVIKTTPHASDRIIINNEAPERFTTPIRQWFERESRLVHERWTKENVQALVEDADGTLERAMSRIASSIPRQKQKTFWMLVVARVFGWNIETTIRKLVEKQPEDDLFEEHKQYARDIIEREFTTRGKRESFAMPMSEFKKRLDEICDIKHAPYLRLKGELSFIGFRRDIGFVEDTNEARPRGGARELTFDARVFKALEIDLEHPHQATIDEANIKGDFEVRIERAIALHAEGKSNAEIEADAGVGMTVFEHCLKKGIIQAIGGRET
jgi:hypothetical protein